MSAGFNAGQINNTFDKMSSKYVNKVKGNKKYTILIPILLLAGFLRTHNTGDEFFGGDDAYISIKAIQIARYGETHLLGPPSSLGLVHSPLSVYLYAVPYLFSPDPRGAQVFTGLVNTIAVGLVYLIARRYFGQTAGIIGALLYAVHPHMVFASRVINNAQLGAPFVMLFIFTGLLGYYENKGWARISHLPLLSLAGQCHPHTFALAPISVIIIAHCWYRRPQQHRTLLAHTAVGAVIAALLLIPWGVGLYQFSQHVDVLQRLQDMPSTGEVQHTTSYAGLGHIFDLAYTMERVPDNWLRTVQAAITVSGSAWLLFITIRRREILPGSIFVLGLILVPAITWMMQVHWVIDYWWSSLPNAFLVQGAFLGSVSASKTSQEQGQLKRAWSSPANIRHLKWASFLLVFCLLADHVTDYIFTKRAPPPISLDDLVSAMDTAVERSMEVDKEMMVIVSPGHGGLTWAFLREYALFEHGLKSTLVLPERALPLPDDGAVLVGDESNQIRAFLFSNEDTLVGNARLALLPPADYFIPDLRPLRPLQFSNGTEVHGFFRQVPGSLPTAGERWTVFMIWKANSSTPQDFQVFTHIVDDHEHKYAQSDVRGLLTEQWHNGGLFASQLDFDLPDDLPNVGPLYLRFGMYDSSFQANVVDDNGNTTGNYGVIQIRIDAPPLTSWSNSLALTNIHVDSPIQQGQPIIANATWFASNLITDNLQLEWQLFDSNNVLMHQSVTDVVPDVSGSRWSAGVFSIQQYDLQIPTDLTPGMYRLELRVVSLQREISGEPYKTTVEVIARDRTFDTPALTHLVKAKFGGEIELLGYDLDKKALNLELTLVWRALGNITRDYKYFVHLWKGEQVVAQVDSMPREWLYPTSWWAPQEVVSETVSFDMNHLESGNYILTTGFYNPESGEKLPAVLQHDEGSNAVWVTLGEVSHE